MVPNGAQSVNETGGDSTLSKALDLIMGTTGKRAGLHDLRHTFATHLVAKGTDAKTAGSLMGRAKGMPSSRSSGSQVSPAYMSVPPSAHGIEKVS